MPLQSSDKAGEFYLGGEYDISKAKTGDTPVYYSSKDLVTHGVCIGMTGSGKTGLCVALLEECALSGIPAIIVDPKGDLTNLELTFPSLSPEEFRPWINEEEARRRGISPDEFAAQEAQAWTNGLAQWGLGPGDIKRLREKVDLRIFTPGSSAGAPLSILRSFDPPSDAVLKDDELRREQVSGVASAILGLLQGADASVQGREHILLATILEQRWLAKESTDLAALIQLIQSPPFQTLGALALETFFPAKDRMKLVLDLNSLLAAPSFQNWLSGEPLSIETLLKAPDGRPRLSVCYIAHLGEAERMFFVSLLLNQTIAWMRTQSGASGLRALLYFDEIFGYLPPHPKDPASKRLLLTILKQGRAFGLGTMLVTQNPVDLDYKALSNCGTWLIGRLQTEQDKARILDGLQGAMDQAGNTTDRKSLDGILSKLGKRVFLLHNVHSGKPQVFHSRWAMSYLAGPLTRDQLRQLKPAGTPASVPVESVGTSAGSLRYFTDDEAVESSAIAPAVAAGLSVRYLQTGNAVFTASLFAQAQILFKDSRGGQTLVKDFLLRLPADSSALDWDHSEILPPETPFVAEAPSGARYAPLPAVFFDTTALKKLGSTIDDHLMNAGALDSFECPALKEKSLLGESRLDFEERLKQIAAERLAAGIAKLKETTDKKRDTLARRLEKEQGELSRDEERVEARKKEQTVSVMSSIAEGVFSFLSGRKSSAARKVSSAIRSATSKGGITQRAELEVEKTRQNVEMMQAQIAELDAALATELQELTARSEADCVDMRATRILPTKTGITIKEFGVLWAD